MTSSSLKTSFFFKDLSTLAFFFVSAQDFLDFSKAKTSFLLKGGEAGLGEGWEVWGGKAKEGEVEG